MKNLKAEKLYVQVFNEIRDYIGQNGLKPGDMLPTELEMCQWLGVSRNVLREAIKAMELMGILKAVPGRGSILQELNMEHAFQNLFYFLPADDSRLAGEILDIRTHLELAYTEEVYRHMSTYDIALLRKICDRMCERWEKHGYDSEEDREFYALLFHSLQNRTLDSLFQALWYVNGQYERETGEEDVGVMIENHRRIVEALENQDFDGFRASMIDHFSRRELTGKTGNKILEWEREGLGEHL